MACNLHVLYSRITIEAAEVCLISVPMMSMSMIHSIPYYKYPLLILFSWNMLLYGEVLYGLLMYGADFLFPGRNGRNTARPKETKVALCVKLTTPKEGVSVRTSRLLQCKLAGI
jgi:hypothetical protein